MAACPHAGALPCQHVVVFNVALSGHVIPTLPIVAQLVAAGHKVTYYTSDTEHQAAVETVGAEHRVVTPLAQANADADGKRGSMLDLMVTGLKALPWILDSVRSLTPPPSVIFNDVLAVWGQWAGQVLGIPTVCSSSTFVLDDGETNNFQLNPTEVHFAAVQALAERYSIQTKLEDLLTSYGTNTLVYTTRSLQPSGDWSDHPDRTFHFVGPMLDAAVDAADTAGDAAPNRATSPTTPPRADPSDAVAGPLGTAGGDNDVATDEGDPTLPDPRSGPVKTASDADAEFLQRFNDAQQLYSRTIYISMGTAIVTSGKFWRQVERAFPETSDTLVVCALGRSAGEVTPPTGANIVSSPKVPQKLLLGTGKVNVFVTHAGMNSVHEGLWCGVPMLCIPHLGDQPYNASLVEQRGCGIMMDSFDVRVASMKAAVEDLIDTPGFAETAATLQSELRAAGGPKAAAAVILRVSEPNGGAQDSTGP